jgi:hypothetical protein
MRTLDTLLGSLRGCSEGVFDKRRGMNACHSMSDIGMAAFSLFAFQSGN